jgi:hypothetical protein
VLFACRAPRLRIEAAETVSPLKRLRDAAREFGVPRLTPRATLCCPYVAAASRRVAMSDLLFDFARGEPFRASARTSDALKANAPAAIKRFGTVTPTVVGVSVRDKHGRRSA